MIKKFTIHAMSCKEISPGKGSIIWQLSDEKGLPRKITGIADMDTQGIIHAVHAVYSREKPLVEFLMYRQEGETFTIDFSEFNRQQAYAPREAYRAEPRKSRSAAVFSFSFSRVLMALVLVCVLCFIYAAVTDVMTMSRQFPAGVR